METNTPVVFEASEEGFEREVVERSKSVPVVVDFWAPWCAPCRALGPVLEALAHEYGGQFLLAKVNVDQCPGVAAAFGARSIPMVVGLRDGHAVSHFTGALPEAAVREFLARVLPSEAEVTAREADRLFVAGELPAAEAMYNEALQSDARCDRALLGRARILAQRGDRDDALGLLERIAPGSEIAQAADRLAARLRVEEASGSDVAGLRARIETAPDDLDARFALAQGLAAAEQYEAALEQYLEILERDRSYRDEAARKGMLDIFEILGPGDERVDRYRSELAKVLYS